MRRWEIEGSVLQNMGSFCGGTGQVLHIQCQPAGIQEKTTITMNSTDYIASLRAEISLWWEKMVQQVGS